MIRTDGRPTIAWAEPPTPPESVAVPKEDDVPDPLYDENDSDRLMEESNA